ncbi:hypothetical protein [Escherichia coli]|nr:hypothetical protein [Escherichia coli]
MYQSVQDGICCCWVLHQTMPFICKHPVKAHCAITGVMAGRIQSA